MIRVVHPGSDPDLPIPDLGVIKKGTGFRIRIRNMTDYLQKEDIIPE
jgi:hypothetical protein